MSRHLRFGVVAGRRLIVGTAALLALTVLAAIICRRVVWPAEQLAAAEQALRQHELPDVRGRLERYLARRPNDPRALLLAARAASQSGDYAGAERFLSRYEQTAGPTDAGKLEWA